MAGDAIDAWKSLITDFKQEISESMQGSLVQKVLKARLYVLDLHHQLALLRQANMKKDEAETELELQLAVKALKDALGILETCLI